MLNCKHQDKFRADLFIAEQSSKQKAIILYQNSRFDHWQSAISCMGGVVITIITVSFQAIKVASANPVRSLRAE